LTENLALERPMRYCKQPGCSARSRNANGFCDAHQEKNIDKDYVRERNADPTDRFYKTARWYRFRRMIIEQNWQCQRLLGIEQCGNAANIVHHLRSPRDYPQGMFDPKNVAALCAGCHPGGVAGTPDWVEGRHFVRTVFEMPNF
jgi:5-methylcytosine-specific restriction protein A